MRSGIIRPEREKNALYVKCVRQEGYFGMVIKGNDAGALEIMPDLDSYDLTLLTGERVEGGAYELQPVYPPVKIPGDNDHPKTFKEMFAYTFNKYVNDLRKSNPQSADRVGRTINPEYHNKK